MAQTHWMLCPVKNCDWSSKITPLPLVLGVTSRGMKPYSESRIELRDLQFLKNA